MGSVPSSEGLSKKVKVEVPGGGEGQRAWLLGPLLLEITPLKTRFLRAMVILEMFASFQHFSHEKMEPILGEVKLDLTCVVVLKDLPQKFVHEVWVGNSS